MNKFMRSLAAIVLFLTLIAMPSYAGLTPIVGGEAGGVEEGADVGFGNITATSIKVGAGTVGAPSIAIGGVTSGFYESGTNVNITVGGIQKGGWTASYLYGTYWLIWYGGAISGTVPAYTFPGDADTGLGKAGDGQVSLTADGVESGRFDNYSIAGGTNFLLHDVDNDTLERVTVDAADSCGSGYKCLRIPN